MSSRECGGNYLPRNYLDTFVCQPCGQQHLNYLVNANHHRQL
jgi:hypothetical protein